MKLNPPQLDGHLKKSLVPIYLVTGEELVLKNEAMQLIRRAAKQQAYTERFRFSSASEFNWEDLQSVLQSTSLMATKKIVELDFRDQLPPKMACTILEAYANNPSPDTLLLIELGKLEDKISRAAWFKACDKAGVTLTYWPLSRDQLPAWLQQRAQKYKLSLSINATQLLADYVEGNLVAATHMLEKLYLMKLEGSITSAQLEPILADESRYSVFDLMDAVLNAQLEKTHTILKGLQEDGVEAPIVLWAITRELRLLAQLGQEKGQGQTLDSLFQKHRIFTKRQPGFRRFLQKNQPNDCLRYLTAAEKVDACIKGAAPGKPFEALTLLCLSLV